MHPFGCFRFLGCLGQRRVVKRGCRILKVVQVCIPVPLRIDDIEMHDCHVCGKGIIEYW